MFYYNLVIWNAKFKLLFNCKILNQIYPAESGIVRLKASSFGNVCW